MNDTYEFTSNTDHTNTVLQLPTGGNYKMYVDFSSIAGIEGMIWDTPTYFFEIDDFAATPQLVSVPRGAALVHLAAGQLAEERLARRAHVERAAELGGMLRSGVEDTFYLPNGEKTTGNGPLIEALAQCARDAGREVASPDEARAMLGFN